MVVNHIPSNYGRRGEWISVHRQPLSLEDTEEIWAPSNAELCKFPLTQASSGGQVDRQNASQVEKVQLKCLCQWCSTIVLILSVCTYLQTNV